MRVFHQLADWQKWRAQQKQTIGFVATMGALHGGHIALVEQSLANNNLTVVSIFINPAQFDQTADLEAYPIQMEKDLQLLESVGVDVVLIPVAEEVYLDNYRYKVTESDFSSDLCGTHRPGHFEGMLTVVMRLLNLVQPARAYFGEKDWQQLQLIKGMVKAFFMPVEIVPVATMREHDGLAMSSRNTRLSSAQRTLAGSFSEIISSAESAKGAREELSARGFKVDYVADRNFAGKQRRLAAVHLGSTRLIDNIGLNNE